MRVSPMQEINHCFLVDYEHLLSGSPKNTIGAPASPAATPGQCANVQMWRLRRNVQMRRKCVCQCALANPFVTFSHFHTSTLPHFQISKLFNCPFAHLPICTFAHLHICPFAHLKRVSYPNIQHNIFPAPFFVAEVDLINHPAIAFGQIGLA